MTNRPTTTTPRARTYDGQASLPRLPIPSLTETLQRFPSTVRALLNDKDFEECLASVQKFLEEDGPKLQEMLVEYEREGREKGTLGSYVEEFWSEAYLAPDSSVVMNLNPFFVLEVRFIIWFRTFIHLSRIVMTMSFISFFPTDISTSIIDKDGPDTKKSKSQCARAASLCFSAIKIVSSLRNETFVPDSFRGKPLCMDQFRALFGACRVPEFEEKDTVAVDTDSTHILVLVNNQMYFFQALWEDGALAVDEEDLVEILTGIREDAWKVAAEVSSHTAMGVSFTKFLSLIKMFIS